MERLRGSIAVLLCLALAMPSASAFAQAAPPPAQSAVRSHARQPYQAGQLRGNERILHALNRFTFGPRPGDLEAVKAMGLEKWFVQQLHPATINQSDLYARLAQFPAMQESAEALLVRLPNGPMIRQAIEGKAPIPQGGAVHSVYENEIARYEIKQQQKEKNKQQQALVAASTTMPGQTMMGNTSTLMSDGTYSVAAPIDAGQANNMAADNQPETPAPSDAQVQHILSLQPQIRVATLGTMRQPEFDAFRKALKGPKRLALNDGLNPTQKEVVAALENPQRVVNEELAAQRLTHDIYSNAQLQEVMTDFWLNHFNVYLHKNEETPYYLVSYERDVIRPLALGKFEDLLEATAHSPAMLLYLDNSSSMGPDSPAAEKAKMNAARRPDAQKKAPEGLNENYARELMELHTLGVNGGYTQADVTQVARVLTGWTVDRPQRGGGFKFDENRHEPGTKKVLGKKIKEHGELEGRQVLHMLATNPATARFISRKLAIRFVGDEPPQPLIDRMAGTFHSSGGDISEVLKTLFKSPEFWSTEAYRAKIKTPLEYVVSAARASNATIDSFQPFINNLHDMGMPLYGAVPPTGYKWVAADWVSTGALVNRMNFALNLAANKLPGIAITWSAQDGLTPTQSYPVTPPGAAQTQAAASMPNPIPAPDAEEARLEALLVAGGLSLATRSAVLEQFTSQSQAQNGQSQLTAKPVPAAKPMKPGQAAAALEKQDQLLAGLLLGSPEFQRR
jgi:uncharacterized protein (DUF1800 family)